MEDLKDHLGVIEMKLELILDRIDMIYTPIQTKWLSEPNTMKVLNLTKRGMEELRQKQILRSSSATGRNFLYYIPDVENYLYDNSAVRKRTPKKTKMIKKRQ